MVIARFDSWLSKLDLIVKRITFRFLGLLDHLVLPEFTSWGKRELGLQNRPKKNLGPTFSSD
jgi:hypothetical protein